MEYQENSAVARCNYYCHNGLLPELHNSHLFNGEAQQQMLPFLFLGSTFQDNSQKLQTSVVVMHV